MTEPTWLYRQQYGMPAPTNMDGSRRPPLAEPLDIVTVHYRGVDGDLVFATPAQVGEYMVQTAEPIARAEGHPFEYSYMLPAMVDRSQAVIVEYAGTYRAAHANKKDGVDNNSMSYGVQFMCAIGQTPTPGQIAAFHAFRAAMTGAGKLTGGHRVIPHHAMPDAATQCPGYAIEEPSIWAQLVAPIDQEAPVGSNTELVRYRDKRYANIFLMPSGMHLSPALDEAYTAFGVQLVEDTHDQTLTSLLYRNGLSPSQLVPR
jgi:hypothetical protein